MVDQSPQGHVVLDPDRRVLLWSAWIAGATGVPTSSALGCTLVELFGAPSLAPRLLTAIDAALESGNSSRLSWAFTPHPFPIALASDPECKMIQSVSISTYGDPTERSCMLVVEDNTSEYEREVLLNKRSLELKELNSLLEEKNQHLDEFTRQASHDLQEPLRKVQAFSELLLQDLGDDVNADAKSDLRIIKSSIDRMEAMVQGLLSLAGAGSEAMAITNLPLIQTVEQAMEPLSLKIQQSQAKIEIARLPMVSADHRLVALVFQNLIGNAIKFCQGDSPQLSITHELKDGCDVFGVKDNGIGIDADQSQEIFEPFKRLHGPNKFQGAGIGLSICERAVTRHGGRIWVESRAGQGAHFKFMLGTAA